MLAEQFEKTKFKFTAAKYSKELWDDVNGVALWSGECGDVVALVM